MSLPQVGHVLTDWEEIFTIKTVTRTTVDFEETTSVATRSQRCVIQPANKEQLNPETIDWSLEYIWIHSKDTIEIGEYVTFQGADYKVVQRAGYGRYGYTEVIAEQTKKNIVGVI